MARPPEAPHGAPQGEAPLPDDAIARERGPLRRCIVTRAVLPKERLLRFVLGPGRELLPDPGGRLPGRGLWLEPQEAVLSKALKQGAFARAARGPVVVPPDLRARILSGLRGRVRDFLGLARRGGAAVAGREAVLEWLRAGRVALLVQASDGSPAERERLQGGHALPVVLALTAAELGAVFGRERAVHAAVAPGGLAEALWAEAARLAGFAPEVIEPRAMPA
ncbi:MAG: RNA-binding protein [Roseococcus sp.]|nr:RNA-binding protein [Roseococcus sp.]